MPTYYYPTNTTNSTCVPSAADGDHTMAKSWGGSTTHTSNCAGYTSYTLVRSYQIDVSGDSPLSGSQSYDGSISVNANSKCDFRVRLISADSGCTTSTPSSYHEEINPCAGDYPFTLSMDGFSGSEIYLRLEVEAKENSTHATREITFDVQDSGTYVLAPWPVASTVSVPQVV